MGLPWIMLDTDEKLEALKKDNERVFDVLNALRNDCGDNYHRINQVTTKLKKAEEAIEALERRLLVKA